MTDREIRKKELTEYLNELWWNDDIDSDKYQECIDGLDEYLNKQDNEKLGFAKTIKRSL